MSDLVKPLSAEEYRAKIAEYHFECEAGPLEKCVPYLQLLAVLDKAGTLLETTREWAIEVGPVYVRCRLCGSIWSKTAGAPMHDPGCPIILADPNPSSSTHGKAKT
jgi:hypothetical protein